MLIVKNLKVSVESKEILKGVDLEVGRGQIHVVMGPNGSGKSTLAKVLAGSPEFIVIGGKVIFDKKDIKKLTPDKRAKLGIFLGFQHPVEIPGVSVFNVLRKSAQVIAGLPVEALAKVGPVSAGVGNLSVAKKRSTKLASNSDSSSRLAQASASNNGNGLMKGEDSAGSVKFLSDNKISHQTVSEFRQQLLEYASSLKLADDFLRRSLNEGFSGGEKKRSEILQMLALKPKLVILDEIDSGLDVDGLKLVADAIKRYVKENPYTSFIVITHYARILKYLKPDFVHVMVDGKIVKSGKMKLAKEIEEVGYQSLNGKRLATKL